MSKNKDDVINCAICRKDLEKPRHEYRDLKFPEDPALHFCDKCINNLLDEVTVSQTAWLKNIRQSYGGTT